MKEKHILFLILVFALAARIIYIAPIAERPADSMSDEKDYDHLALSLAAGKGYVDLNGAPTVRRAPLTAAFFSLIYIAFGHNVLAVRVVQALLSVLTCLLVYLIAGVFFNGIEALLAASIAAIYPSFIIFTGKLLSETLLIFLITLSVYLMLKKRGNPLGNYFLSGLCFGLASLTRPSSLLVPLFIILTFAIFKILSAKDMAKKIVCLTIAMLIVISPWTARNWCAYKKFILVNTEFGYICLCSYFYPKAGFGFQDQALADNLTKGIKDEAEKSSVLARYTVTNIMKDPPRFIKLVPLKFLWFWEPFDGKDFGFNSSYNIIYGLSFLFFLFGLAASRTAWRDLLPLYAVIVYFIILSLVFFGYRRYRMQIEPFIVIFAAYGLSWVWREAKRSRAVFMIAVAGLIFNLLFFIWSDNMKSLSRKTANFFGYSAFSKK